MNDPWQITLLGGLRAQQGERVITRFKTQRVAALFAYLAYHPRQVHSRELLMELLWPESDSPTLRNSLSVALSSLRHQFEPPGVPQGTVLRADRFSVGLNPAVVETDVVRFERALQAASRAGSSLERAQYLTEAVDLYGGPLLPGFYEEWIFAEQERLSGLFLDALGALVSHLERTGDTGAALAHARRAVAADPLREEGQQHLIRLLAADRQPAAAMRQYREYERLREEEIGGEPSPALRALFRQIQAASGPSEPAAATPARRIVPSAHSEPGGPDTVTFLLTDIEGSTRLFQGAPEAYGTARERHHALLRAAFRQHAGREVKELGDGFVTAFPTAASAVAAAVGAQRALSAADWPEETGPLKVRMALHTGDVRQSPEDGEYHGLVLHHASRMLTAAHGGQILVSDVTASLLQGSLEDGLRLVDLGIYRLRDIPEVKRLFQMEYPGMLQADFGPLAAEAGHQANVPPRFTRFFGREQEMEQLRELLLSERVRLVTVTGPGGTGKTRLALEVAESLAASFAGAVYFCPLAERSEPALLACAVLDSLRAPRGPEREPLEQAIEALAKQPTLLVLDNFEHLVEAGAEIVWELLSRVPTLKLLITSRQLLGLSAEHELGLSPLPVPGSGETPERLCLYESVQLFIDRAQQVMPHFQVSGANAAAVAALVAGLEGIPLAIELAAARVQVLTPAQMLAQLSRRFDLLAGRKRDVPERQRTLRGAVEWSYRMLTPELQRFFSRLSVFRGGWSMEAAAAVGEEPLALDYLAQLRECSLVQTEEGAEGIRFRMLETLRDYAVEQLSPAERHAAEERHRDCFLGLVEEAAPQLRGADQVPWLQRLETDHDNFRAALERCLARARAGGDTAAAALRTALRLCEGLWHFWSVRGHLTEGRRTLAAVLEAVPADHPELGRTPLRARALTAAGVLAHDQSDYAAARRHLEESAALWRELAPADGGAEREGLAHAVLCLANLHLDDGRPEAALAHYEEALGLYRESADARGTAVVLSNLGVLHLERGEVDRAAELLAESIRLKRRLGNPFGLAMSLESLGNLERSRGNRKRALELCREALELRRELDHRLGIAMSLNNLGHLLLEDDDAEGGQARLRESLDLFLELNEPRGAIEALTGLAGTFARLGRHEEAARLMAAMEAQREASGFEPRPCEHVVIRRWRGEIRQALDDARLQRAWRQGRELSFDEAVAEARRC